MAQNTGIEWCDATFNPWIGCTKVGPGCDHCYAEQRMDKRLHVVNWGAGQPRKRTSDANWRQPERWNDQPFCECPVCGWRGDGAVAGLICPSIDCSGLLVAARRRVFCASLADVFDNEVDPSWRADLFFLIDQTPNLDWLLLTKRIGNVQRMAAEADEILGAVHRKVWPLPNVWLGATVVNQAEADRDIPKLLATPAAVRFLSMEPLLGPVDLERIKIKDAEFPEKGQPPVTFKALTGWHGGAHQPDRTRLDWVIVGGESGPNARPMHPDWARSLRNQCAAAGVRFLFKQWGEWGPTTWEASRYTGVLGSIRGDDIAFTAFGPAGRRIAIPVAKVGKKAAGRLLDGKTHDGFPEVRHA